MDLHETAQGYLESIEFLDKRIGALEIERNNTNSFEIKRKINDKLNDLRKVKRELQFTYAHLLNYYDKDVKVRVWI